MILRQFDLGEFLEDYPTSKTEDVAKKYSITPKEARTWASRYGVKKTISCVPMKFIHGKFLLELHYRGFTKECISQMLDVSKATIDDRYRRLGVYGDGRLSEKTFEMRELIKKYEYTLPIRENAIQLGVPYKTLEYHLEKNGVIFNRRRPISSKIAQSLVAKKRNERYGNPSKSETARRKISESAKKRIADDPERMTNILLRRNHITYIERAMIDALAEQGLIEGKEYAYNKYLKVEGGFKYPDFRFEEQKLVIEADGERFHTNDEKERKRDVLIQKAGYKVMHFTGKEIIGSRFKDKLRDALGEVGIEDARRYYLDIPNECVGA